MIGKVMLIALGVLALNLLVAVAMILAGERMEGGNRHVREAEAQEQEPEDGGKKDAGGAVLPERHGQAQGEEIRP